MTIILENAILAEFDPIRAEPGELRIEKGTIVERAKTVSRESPVAPSPAKSVSRETQVEVIDCRGAVVLPGMVNGHTHLYSALAVGMPPPPKTPTNFYEILKYVWWRLDQALDADSIETSARSGALEALRCGTTTLIDHHASPNAIAGSLDAVEKGLADVGLRGVLCYETTDRHGSQGRFAGLEENRRYLEKRKHVRDGRFGALVGAHASFTLEDETLGQLAALVEQFDSGLHIHVAEDPCDEQDALDKRGQALIDRLADHFFLQPDSIFAHGTHLKPAAIARVNDLNVTMAHNPRSNMNNAVGYAPLASFTCPVMLGTDGIGSDMFAEARAAWFVARHQKAGLSPADIVEMLAAAARRASRLLGVTVGKLEVGSAADVVVSDYVPFTPLTTDNLAGHLLFGLSAQHVQHVLVGGERKLRDRTLVDRDEPADRAAAQEVAAALWRRMAEY